MDELQERIIAFVSSECGVDRNSLTADTSLFGDLCIDGADGYELLQALGREFGVDMRACDPGLHFGPECVCISALMNWIVYAFRSGTPEQRVGLLPVRIMDLLQSAKSGRWHVDRCHVGHWLCRTCSYNLTANTSGVCPECGTPIPRGLEEGAKGAERPDAWCERTTR